MGCITVSALTVLPQLFLSSPEMYLKDKRIAILPISIMYLTDNRYSFPSIVLADKTLKNANKIKYLVSLSLKKDYYPVFSSSFDFSYTLLPDYLPYRTSSIDLSRNRSKVSFPIPEGIKPNTARVSIQSLYNYGVSLFINGKQYQLPSRANPKWETIEIEIDTTDNSLDIELDFKNCSSPDAKILIGNVSLFE